MLLFVTCLGDAKMLKKSIIIAIFIVILFSVSPLTVIKGTNSHNVKTEVSQISMNHGVKAYSGNSIEVAVSPDGSFNLLKSAVLKANQSIYIEVYQFWSDDIFDIINQTLHSKPSIVVKVIVENDTGYRGSLGGADEYNRYYANKFYQLKQDGFNVTIKLENTWNYHHGKIIIVDEKLAFVSSDNFVPTAFPIDPFHINKIVYDTPSRGWMALINDQETVSYFTKIFNQDLTGSVDYTPSMGTGIKPSNNGVLSFDAHFTDSVKDFDVKVKPVVSPYGSLENISDLIQRANHTIIIEQIYIKESVDDLINLLIEAHQQRNVTVMIILEDDYPGNYDDMASTLESYGFHVIPAFQGFPLFLHNKGIIVDDKLVFIGSINWSSSAFNSNREFGIIVESRKIASYLRGVYQFDWNISRNESTTLPFDSDSDGLPDYYEIEHGLNPNSTDTDGDGFSDYEEVYILGTDPTAPNFVSLVAPKNGTYINRTSVSLVFKITSLTSVKQIEVELNNVAYGTYTPSYNNTINVTGLIEGENTIKVVLKNETGSPIFSFSLKIYVDLTPPNLEILSPQNGTTYAITSQIDLRWSVEDQNPVTTTIYIDSKYFEETSGTNVTISVLKNKLITGRHNITVISRDAAGNGVKKGVYIYVSAPVIEELSITPKNNSKVYSKNVDMRVTVKIQVVNVTNVLIKYKSGIKYPMNFVSKSGNTWTWEKRIYVENKLELKLIIVTEFYNFTKTVIYELETNPILVFAHNYGPMILAVLILVIALAVLAKKK